MPRYDEMDDLLRRVRARLGHEEAPAESQLPAVEARATQEAMPQGRQYERVMACTESLLRDAEELREVLSPERVYALSATQHEHILAVLNSVLHELWSAEVRVRRARLND